MDKPTFLRHLHVCHALLKDQAGEDSGKPAYFRFLTVMAFKVFLEADVDVAILEVGVGGRLDATNCVAAPVVCGVTALGFDHMAMLGYTLPEIAREKAGIFKASRPALTSPQRADAAEALQEVAQRVGTPLSQPRPLNEYTLAADGTGAAAASASTLELGLAGEHQRENAALAVALAAEWEALSPVAAARQGQRAQQRAESVRSGVLPPEYVAGLKAAKWPGRGQIIHDALGDAREAATSADSSSDRGAIGSSTPGTYGSSSSSLGAGTAPGTAAGQEHDAAAAATSRLTFYLDGAHTAESVAMCGRWFASASAAAPAAPGLHTQRLLLFNCMEERDPLSLLQPLASTLAEGGSLPQHALFVPTDSVYTHLGPADAPPDLAWQMALRGVWEKLVTQQRAQLQHQAQHLPAGARAAAAQGLPPGGGLLPLPAVRGLSAPQQLAQGAVLPNLRTTLAWLRRCVHEAPSLRLHVLVTGSLYVVGDLLRLLGSPQGGGGDKRS